MELIYRQTLHKLVLLVTHDTEEALLLSQLVYVLEGPAVEDQTEAGYSRRLFEPPGRQGIFG
jgi:ABC-type nitrate/sulfonate/bicarbonate transport system ATPase subunit